MREIRITLILSLIVVTIYVAHSILLNYSTKEVNKNIHSQKIVSEVVKETPLDNRMMPSYCKPNQYKIKDTGRGFLVLLPGGTPMDIYHQTVEEAQDEINKLAASSKDRWISSNGVEF